MRGCLGLEGQVFKPCDAALGAGRPRVALRLGQACCNQIGRLLQVIVCDEGIVEAEPRPGEIGLIVRRARWQVFDQAADIIAQEGYRTRGAGQAVLEQQVGETPERIGRCFPPARGVAEMYGPAFGARDQEGIAAGEGVAAELSISRAAIQKEGVALLGEARGDSLGRRRLPKAPDEGLGAKGSGYPQGVDLVVAGQAFLGADIRRDLRSHTPPPMAAAETARNAIPRTMAETQLTTPTKDPDRKKVPLVPELIIQSRNCPQKIQR